METTITLSMNLHVPLFEIFDRECDEIIMLLNFYMQRHSKEQKSTMPAQSKARGSEERIRVNDKTATGGWF